jgi:hypothetical protein
MDHQSSHQAHNSDPKLSRAINVRRAGEARALHQTLDEQMRILTAIKASLAVHHETLDDADLMMVLAGGETSLLETIDALLEADMYDEALLDGLKLQKDTLAVRLHRFRERRESRRSIAPFRGPSGAVTTLIGSVFSTVPGSPAYVGKASQYRQKSPELKQDIDIQGHNAILSEFRFDYQAAA